MASTLLIIGLFLAVANSAEVQSGALFDYGVKFGDTKLEVNSPTDVLINIAFRFYGREYTNIYIAKNGHISFGEVPAQVMTEHLPYRAPHADPPMAAVYFAAINKILSGDDEGVYYRTAERTDELYPEILKTLGHQVRINSVNDMSRFWPKRAVIVTWHNVRHQGCITSPCPRNTYQAAIMTDDIWTYAIYNYGNLTWRGGVLQGCDRPDGLGASCFSAQVGFNAGGGREFTPLPFSGSENVLKLQEHQGSKTKGRYIYQVSSRKIIRDGCSTADTKLTIYPHETGMFGGTEIHCAGPCLPEHATAVTCKVGNSAQFEGTILDTGRISCITPMHYGLGEEKITVTYDNQVYMERIKIAAARRTWTPVILDDYSTTWLQRDPEELKLSWSPVMLNGLYIEPENTTTDPPKADEVLVENVIIALFGYAEITTGQSSETVWKFLKVLAHNPNSGQFSFKPAEHRCTPGGEAKCIWHIGAIKIIPADGDPESSRGLFSDLFPMGWYLETEMVKSHGEHWPDKLCEEWQDDADVKWEDGLIECPCTRAQAYTDIGNFIIDPDCDGTGPCPFHPDAGICFMSRVPTQTGAQTRCCYKTIEGMAHDSLIFSSAIASGGSFSSAVHEDGLYPYKLSKKHYPLFSHWIMDKLPMIWCCVWSFDADLCLTHYEHKRQTPGCARGRVTQSAFAFGDPHFMTFDGTHYTFNGYAEYWLLRVHELDAAHNFRLQARMENYIGIIRNLNATVITAVAMQQGDDADTLPRITLFLNPPLALERISVFVDDVYQDFYTVDSRGHFDKNDENMMYITRNSDASFSNNFTMKFSNGASVNVAEKAGMIQVKATAPPSFFERTSGLFGFWDGDSQNDLRTRDGTVDVDPNNNLEVHEKFGADWAVGKTETIFTYFKQDKWEDYQQESFKPVFAPEIPAGSNLTNDKVTEKCQGDNFCRYDYIVTNNDEVATASLAAQAWALQVRDMAKKVDTCPYLDVHYSKRSPDSSNIAGGKVTLMSCVNGYTLRGPSEYQCVPQQGRDAAWAPVPSSTICKSNQAIAMEQQQTAVAIAVPITLVFLILLISIAAFMIFRRKKINENKQTFEPDNLPRQQPPVNPNPSASLYTYPEANLSLSKTSVSSHVSRGSDNSIILEQVIHPQRPPRPVKTLPRRDDQGIGERYANVPGEHDNESYNREHEQQMAADREFQPQFHAPPPPIGAYDNRGSDVMADDEVMRLQTGGSGGVQPTNHEERGQNMGSGNVFV